MAEQTKPLDVLRAAIDRMNAKASGPTRWVQLRPHEADALLAAVAELVEAAAFASDVCAELYAKYQTRIGPFASQAQFSNVRLRTALAAVRGGA